MFNSKLKERVGILERQSERMDDEYQRLKKERQDYDWLKEKERYDKRLKEELTDFQALHCPKIGKKCIGLKCAAMMKNEIYYKEMFSYQSILYCKEMKRDGKTLEEQK